MALEIPSASVNTQNLYIYEQKGRNMEELQSNNMGTLKAMIPEYMTVAIIHGVLLYR